MTFRGFVTGQCRLQPTRKIDRFRDTCRDRVNAGLQDAVQVNLIVSVQLHAFYPSKIEDEAPAIWLLALSQRWILLDPSLIEL